MLDLRQLQAFSITSSSHKKGPLQADREAWSTSSLQGASLKRGDILGKEREKRVVEKINFRRAFVEPRVSQDGQDGPCWRHCRTCTTLRRRNTSGGVIGSPPPPAQPGQGIQLKHPGLGHPVQPLPLTAPAPLTALRPPNIRMHLPLNPQQALICFLGLNSGPSTWPETSCLAGAIFSQLCRVHPCSMQSGGIKRTRWALILADYVSIKEAVLESLRLLAQTNVQLLEVLSVPEGSGEVCPGAGIGAHLVLPLQLLLEVRQLHFRSPDLHPFLFAVP
ncbi:hypothetical protein UPYG_G00281110 [Umbra pygmaea]|uniref:Uncharacterized protein n=1 Tax=Umbra pygmaea TaxID=75934 RepID=A0ABD0W7H0_UMBPY